MWHFCIVVSGLFFPQYKNKMNAEKEEKKRNRKNMGPRKENKTHQLNVDGLWCKCSLTYIVDLSVKINKWIEKNIEFLRTNLFPWLFQFFLCSTLICTLPRNQTNHLIPSIDSRAPTKKQNKTNFHEIRKNWCAETCFNDFYTYCLIYANTNREKQMYPFEYLFVYR